MLLRAGWETHIFGDVAGNDFALEAVRTIPDSGRVVRTLCVDEHFAVYAQFTVRAISGAMPAPGQVAPHRSPVPCCLLPPSRSPARKCSDRGPERAE